MHIIPLSQPPQASVADLVEGMVSPEQLHGGLYYLLSCQQKRKQVLSERHFNLTEVITAVENNRCRRLELVERHDFLQKRIKDLTPWGSFVLPAQEDLNGQRLWFYLVPNYKMKEMVHTSLPWQLVHRDNRHSYVAVIAEQEPGLNEMPVVRTHTGAVPLLSLRHELEDIEVALETVEAEREGLTRWIYLLQRSIAGTEDQAQLSEVADQTLDREQIFALQGWLAQDQRGQLEAFAEAQGLVLLIEAVTEDDVPPPYWKTQRR